MWKAYIPATDERVWLNRYGKRKRFRDNYGVCALNVLYYL